MEVSKSIEKANMGLPPGHVLTVCPPSSHKPHVPPLQSCASCAPPPVVSPVCSPSGCVPCVPPLQWCALTCAPLTLFPSHVPLGTPCSWSGLPVCKEGAMHLAAAPQH